MPWIFHRLSISGLKYIPYVIEIGWYFSIFIEFATSPGKKTTEGNNVISLVFIYPLKTTVSAVEMWTFLSICLMIKCFHFYIREVA